FAREMGVDTVPAIWLDRIVDYLRGLGVPVRRHPDAEANQQPNVRLRLADAEQITDPDILEGEGVFMASGCAECHVPELKTGSAHPFAQFHNITIRPFSDLLLWDMGPDLCAESGEGGAGPYEWRTAPLWGTRLQEQVTGHLSLLHDGRATTLDQAIRLHGGVARDAREAYLERSESERERLLLFLRSL
ncbi:MAG: di-heme oxidoredictase family protein, partial [Myxococcota bacterium]